MQIEIREGLKMNISECYEKLGEKDEALRVLDKITDTFPECEEAQEMIREIS